MLTPAQRNSFDVNGYVLLRSVFTKGECRRFIDIADRMKADSTFPRRDSEEGTVVFGSAWYDRHLLDTAMGDRLRPAAEEILGGEARLEENQFIIFHPHENKRSLPPGPHQLGWHRGLNPDYGSYEANGHYHCLLPKTLAYLTDNGPGAGTWAVPGSHRMTMELSEVVEGMDESLTRQVPAKQGDVLLFGETLIHASPSPDLKTDRYLMIIAYSAPFMKPWSANVDPPEGFEDQLTDEQRRFVYGEGRYQFRKK